MDLSRALLSGSVPALVLSEDGWGEMGIGTMGSMQQGVANAVLGAVWHRLRAPATLCAAWTFCRLASTGRFVCQSANWPTLLRQFSFTLTHTDRWADGQMDTHRCAHDANMPTHRTKLIIYLKTLSPVHDLLIPSRTSRSGNAPSPAILAHFSMCHPTLVHAATHLYQP